MFGSNIATDGTVVNDMACGTVSLMFTLDIGGGAAWAGETWVPSLGSGEHTCKNYHWSPPIFKRNEKAFPLNAIVDVRHRHEMFFGNISKTIRASEFKIYHNVALDR